MSWWNLGGMNPNFKAFTEKHPKQTMIGMAWSLYWRLMLFIIVVELIIVGIAALIIEL